MKQGETFEGFMTRVINEGERTKPYGGAGIGDRQDGDKAFLKPPTTIAPEMVKFSKGKYETEVVIYFSPEGYIKRITHSSKPKKDDKKEKLEMLKAGLAAAVAESQWTNVISIAQRIDFINRHS